VEHNIHQTHECSWCIRESEWYHQKLVVPIPCYKGFLVDFLILNSNLVISWPQINLWEKCSSYELIKEIIYPRQRIFFLLVTQLALFLSKIPIHQQSLTTSTTFLTLHNLLRGSSRSGPTQGDMSLCLASIDYLVEQASYFHLLTFCHFIHPCSINFPLVYHGQYLQGCSLSINDFGVFLLNQNIITCFINILIWILSIITVLGENKVLQWAQFPSQARYGQWTMIRFWEDSREHLVF